MKIGGNSQIWVLHQTMSLPTKKKKKVSAFSIFHIGEKWVYRALCHDNYYVFILRNAKEVNKYFEKNSTYSLVE